MVSHWLPFLLFSVATGALADRFDPRRIIQCGMGLFITASLGWGYFFITDTLQMWHAMVLLVIHGCAGVLWQTPNQLLLYDIVGPADLPSAVRLNATARYLGRAGRAGGGRRDHAGAGARRMASCSIPLFYLPLVLWLVNAPYGPRFRAGAPPPQRAVRGFADIVQTARDIAGHPVICHDAPGWRRFVSGRQCLQRTNARLRLRSRPWRSRAVLQHAAGCRRCRRAPGGHRARRPGLIAAKRTHRDRARGAVVGSACGLRAGN